MGASPRGSLALLLLSRARAALAGRDYVIPEDVKQVAVPALAHRISLKPEVWLRQVQPSSIVTDVLASVPAPASGALPSYAAGTPAARTGEEEGTGAPSGYGVDHALVDPYRYTAPPRTGERELFSPPYASSEPAGHEARLNNPR